MSDKNRLEYLREQLHPDDYNVTYLRERNRELRSDVLWYKRWAFWSTVFFLLSLLVVVYMAMFV